MARVEMPTPPEGHYWLVYKFDGIIEDYLNVELRRDPKARLSCGRLVANANSKWVRDEEVNALSAKALAGSILSDPKVTGSCGLNGLEGYVWGGVR